MLIISPASWVGSSVWSPMGCFRTRFPPVRRPHSPQNSKSRDSYIFPLFIFSDCSMVPLPPLPCTSIFYFSQQQWNQMVPGVFRIKFWNTMPRFLRMMYLCIQKFRVSACHAQNADCRKNYYQRNCIRFLICDGFKTKCMKNKFVVLIFCPPHLDRSFVQSLATNSPLLCYPAPTKKSEGTKGWILPLKVLKPPTVSHRDFFGCKNFIATMETTGPTVEKRCLCAKYFFNSD